MAKKCQSILDPWDEIIKAQEKYDEKYVTPLWNDFAKVLNGRVKHLGESFDEVAKSSYARFCATE